MNKYARREELNSDREDGLGGIMLFYRSTVANCFKENITCSIYIAVTKTLYA